MAIKAARDIIIDLVIYHKYDWKAIYDAICKKEQIPEDIATQIDIEAQKMALLHDRYKIYCLLDTEDNPELNQFLVKMVKPPFVIFYKGDLDTVLDRLTEMLKDKNPYVTSLTLETGKILDFSKGGIFVE